MTLLIQEVEKLREKQYLAYRQFVLAQIDEWIEFYRQHGEPTLMLAMQVRRKQMERSDFNLATWKG